mmetsp:Transcript_34096/g.61239  ORF Transcript_34096/g.61239 Transcript_34096/m.61239 type:complete len:115 (-) Transcript_34096:179-523(-)
MLRESGEDNDNAYNIKILVPLYRTWRWTEPVKSLAITPPIPPRTIASSCIVPLTDHLMKEEAAITMLAQKIDEEISTEDRCRISSSGAQCKDPECRYGAHDSTTNGVPQTVGGR